MPVILFALLATLLQASAKPSARVANAQVQQSQTQLSGQGFEELRAQAEAGVAIAQLKLALAYATGDGILMDAHAAFQWCEKAAEQGNADAEAELGVDVPNGLGC